MSANESEQVVDAHETLARIWEHLRSPALLNAAAAVWSIQHQLQAMHTARQRLPPLAAARNGEHREAMEQQRTRIAEDERRAQESMAQLLEHAQGRQVKKLLDEAVQLLNDLDDAEDEAEEAEREHPGALHARVLRDIARLMRGAYTGASTIDESGRAALLSRAQSAQEAAAAAANPRNAPALAPGGVGTQVLLRRRLDDGGRPTRTPARPQGNSRLRDADVMEEALGKTPVMGLRAGLRYFARAY
ncbi:hypothetical protein JCM10450v2_008172 [Rhodotorula kratochvilovae]